MMHSEFVDASNIMRILDRHQRRREQRIATVSALAGPRSTGEWMVYQWAERSGRAVVLPDSPAPKYVAKALITSLRSAGDPVDLVARFLVQRTGSDAARQLAMLRNRSEHEWALYLARVLPDVDEASARALCLSLLTRSNDLWTRIETLPWRVLAALVKMTPDRVLAVLLVARWGDCAELARLLQATAELAERVPQLPVALVINPRELRAWLEAASGSRTRTLIQEGLVELGAHAIDDAHKTFIWLTRQGFQADTLTQCAAAVSVIEQSRQELTSEGATQARSTAERFLYAVLEALPDTAGLFELNGKVAADFGASGMAEVDLVARTPRVAIEIDGYFHFQDREHYRRDRRKDVALQKQGFLVLRFLTEDVVACLEEIVETIRTSLVHQHMQRGNDGAANENISDSL